MKFIKIITDESGYDALKKFIETYNFDNEIQIDIRVDGKSDYSPVLIGLGDMSGSMPRHLYPEVHEHLESMIHRRDYHSVMVMNDFGRRGNHDSEALGVKHLLGLLDEMDGIVLSRDFGKEREKFYLHNYLADMPEPSFKEDEPGIKLVDSKWTPNEKSKDRVKDKNVIWVKARAKSRRAKQARKKNRR